MPEKHQNQRLKTVRGFLLDLDGTMYLGDHLLPGAADFLRFLKEHTIPHLFLTNNSSKHRHQYTKKLQGFGLEASADQIFTSGEATALFLQAQFPFGRIYLVGTEALAAEFAGYQFQLTDHNPEAVVLGFDTTLTYEKLWRLCDFVRAGLPYFATHPDINCPTEAGVMPDIGAMIAFVEASTGRKPDQIIGKPNAPIVSAIQAKMGLPVNQIAMVGDRLYTDIALGLAGLMTILTLTGETKHEDIQASPFQPDLVVSNLSELLEILSMEK